MFLQISFLLFSLFFSMTGFTASGEAAETEAPARKTIEGNIDDIAKTVQTYFPKVTGKVLSIEDQQIEVDLGRASGISEGVLLTVYREKEPFSHPVTGVVLGRFEEEIGTVEVTQIGENRLKAKNVQTLKPVAVGDQVRVPGTKIPMAIALAAPEGQHFLMNELVSALTDTGRFRIDVLPPQSTLEDAVRRNNRYLIQLVTSQADETFLLNLNLQNTATGKSLSDMEIKINQSQESDLILEHLQYQLFEQRRKQKEGTGSAGPAE